MKSNYNKFDLEEALLTMYYVSSDLPLVLDQKEREAALELHTLRCDKIFEIFDDMVQKGKIL